MPDKKSSRKTTQIAGGFTHSLSLESSETLGLQLIKKTPKLSEDEICNYLKLFEKKIKEHATRRVELFFYLMIAFYDKKLDIEKEAAIIQHGAGKSVLETHACHSTLIPHVKLEKSSQKAFLKTSLFQSLNATVELPKIVNGFDGHLEGRRENSALTTECVRILNEVSYARMTPLQGMKACFKALNDEFADKGKYFTEEDNEVFPPKAKELVHDYQKAGSFALHDDALKNLDQDYLLLTLKVRCDACQDKYHKNCKACSDLKESVTEDPKKLKPFYLKAQEEIWDTKFVKKGFKRANTVSGYALNEEFSKLENIFFLLLVACYQNDKNVELEKKATNETKLYAFLLKLIECDALLRDSELGKMAKKHLKSDAIKNNDLLFDKPTATKFFDLFKETSKGNVTPEQAMGSFYRFNYVLRKDNAGSSIAKNTHFTGSIKARGDKASVSNIFMRRLLGLFDKSLNDPSKLSDKIEADQYLKAQKRLLT